MLTWLADVLRSAGLDVYEMPGWDTRGEDRIVVNAVIGHHTATGPNWLDGHVAFLLRDGRIDLAGPLSQLGLERDGTFVVIAAGRCNHNGYGRWGNDAVGIEAYNDGIGEPWPAVQLDAYDRGIAAILDHVGLGTDRYLGHRESDPGRKIDPAGIFLDAQRARVDAIRNPPPLEDDMTPEQAAMLSDVHRLVQETVIDTRAIEPRTKETTLGVRVLLGRQANVDAGDLAVDLVAMLDDDLAAAVADELARRLA